jgi:FAD binding domain-containing protein/berberine-like enzyme
MRDVTRRSLLAGAIGTAAVGLTVRAGVDVPVRATTGTDGVLEPRSIRPGDPRYGDLSTGTNLRRVGTPDEIVLVHSPRQVADAVAGAVRARRRFTVQSGRHCYEDFVTNADIRTVIDVSAMNAVHFDQTRRAFVVEAGTELGELYATLFKDWGVTLPGGSCPSVGAGGHILGGGYGPLCRSLGLTVDHLYGVEVVVVDRDGAVRTVVATRERDDPNRELWWAHTGGGGGNFGIVTRYLLRSPGASGADPGSALPRPPARIWVDSRSWSWQDMSEESFGRLLRNYGDWLAANSAPDSPYTALFSHLTPTHRSNGSIVLATQVDADAPDAEGLLARFTAAIADGVGVAPTVTEHRVLPWLHGLHWNGLFADQPTDRADFKSAYLRRGFTAAQIAGMWRNLTRTDHANPVSLIQIASYGGRTNAVASADTATAQRDSVMKLNFITAWTDPARDEPNIRWLRELYRDMFAETGGVPAPNEVTDGCFVNYADADLGDPRWNTSGVPWHTLYYKDNYRRLQRAKARWDPNNLFRHAQSIELP